MLKSTKAGPEVQNLIGCESHWEISGHTKRSTLFLLRWEQQLLTWYVNKSSVSRNHQSHNTRMAGVNGSFLISVYPYIKKRPELRSAITPYSVFWPWITEDVKLFISKCVTCNSIQKRQQMETLIPTKSLPSHGPRSEWTHIQQKQLPHHCGLLLWLLGAGRAGWLPQPPSLNAAKGS